MINARSIGWRVRKLLPLLGLFGAPLLLAVVAGLQGDWSKGTFWLLLLIVNIIAPWTPRWMTDREVLDD